MAVNRSNEQTGAPQGDMRLATSRITADLLDYIVQKIVQAVAPKQIILFGSRSAGREEWASDLDLFVIQDSGETNRRIRRQIEHLLWGRRFAVDLIVATPEQVDRNVADGNPFYTRHILSEGRILHDRNRQGMD